MNDPSSGSPEQAPTAIWVWYSTSESVEANTVSVLACAETALAVGFYVYVALNYGYLPYWWTSILVAPLLLMRSESSSALGAKWMQTYWNCEAAPKNVRQLTRSPSFLFILLLTLLLACVVPFVLCYVFSTYWLTTLQGLAGLCGGIFIGAIIGITTAATAAAILLTMWGLRTIIVGVAGVSTIIVTVTATGLRLETATGVLIGMGAVAAATAIAESRMQKKVGRSAVIVEVLIYSLTLAVGVWLRTLAIRFFATARHPIAGLQTIPLNWQRALFATDFVHAPELIPRNPIEDITPQALLSIAFHPRVPFGPRIYAIVIAAIFYTPAWIYRLVIKSTCWFYLPLFHLLRERKHERADDPKEMCDRILMHPWNWFGLFIAVVTIIGCVATAAFHDFGSVLKRATDLGPISLLEVLVVLDWSAVKPWQWLAMSSAALTFYVWFNVWNLHIDNKYSNKPKVAEAAKLRAWIIEYALRARTVVSTCWISLLVAHIVVKSPIGGWLPTATQEMLGRFFDGVTA